MQDFTSISSRLHEIQCYTAMGLGCHIDALQKQGSIVISATPPADKNLLVTSSLTRADVICLTEMETCSIIRKNSKETQAVKNLLQQNFVSLVIDRVVVYSISCKGL